MYLKLTKHKNGRTSVSITQSYREGKKSKNRTVASFGYLDELEKVYGDPIAHLTRLRDQMTAQQRDRTAPVSVTIHPAQKVDKRTCNRKNAGCAVPLAFLDSLGIEPILRNHTRDKALQYDVNAVVRLLVTDRLLDPSSKLSAWQGRDRWFFKSDFSDDDLYRALDIIAEAKRFVVLAMNRRIEQLVGRDLENVFYDVTNYHFEIDEEDALRRKGVAKNHMPKPLVQMGLLQDANAIPLAFKVFAGNTPDCDTMLDVLADMKDDLSLKRVIVIADKGLNCSKNIALTVGKGDGFVYSQSIRGTKSTEEVRAWAINDTGWDKATCAEDGRVLFKSKSCQATKTVHLKKEDTEDGRAKDVQVDIKMVAFWSHKYEKKAQHDREPTLKKALELIKSPGRYSAATHYGAAKYVKNVSFDKDTGEILKCATAPVFDEERLAADEACDGYYCIITSETGWSDERIIEAYRGLWQIEESFKITKSDISARPVYVRKKSHIEAHFLICYIALSIARIMQFLTSRRYSVADMLGDLAEVSGSRLESNWWLFDHRSDITDELFALIGEEPPRKHMKLADIKKLLSKGKKIRT
jgi:transposase